MSAVMPRMMELTTPLGKDLLFRWLRGKEELGRASEFEVAALSTRNDIKPSDLLGKKITVKLERVKGGYRYFNGHVTRFAQGDTIGRYYEYRMTVRSWLWFLTRTADCRIFQEKTVPEIIKEVFADHSMAVFDDGLTGTYIKREYCVQYRESDFNFVSRLMEEEGIYYYFEHGDGKHTLKLVDSDTGHKKLDGKPSIAYHLPGRSLHGDEEYIQVFRQDQRIQPGLVATRSYDFAKPKADLGVKAQNIQKHESADYEWYDFEGDYIQTDNGDHLAQVRVDELHSEFELAEAECNVREIAVGRLFGFTNAPRKDQEKDYLIVSAEWDLQNNTYETVTQEDAVYHCTMKVLQSKQQFRPARSTPRPTMGGPQTAVVVGPGGEEIYCDKYGRVKVQFHWDRYGKKDQNSSCWIRVSNPWAGANWGGMAVPRMGQEVVVDFLEGDPDQPIIIGRVYNADQMPPYALPANMTQTGIKSRSSKGGGAANFNEIRFEDKKGSEQVFIHAEKNQDIEVENDETHWVGHDRKKTIDHDETTLVKNNRTETVGVNEKIDIGANRTETVGANESISVTANRTRTVGQNEVVTVGLTRTHTVGVNEAISVGAAQEVTVGGLQAITVGANQTTNVGVNQSTSVGANRSVEVGSNQTTQVASNATSTIGGNLEETISGNRTETVSGNRTETISGNHMAKVSKSLKAEVGEDAAMDVTKNLSFVAGEQIVIKTGDASITMKKDGTIQIKGKDIKIEASGKMVAKADGEMVLKGQSKVTIN
jgi:type VI secretion system secreted protein VgrG